jgi:anthranilate phosphoribosyltransferase
MIKETIKKLSGKQNLSKAEAYETMNEIMTGSAAESQIAAFLMALRLKGETVDEIAGCAQSMREKAVQIRSQKDRIIDTCGTGGDAAGTFNISTTAAIIASAAGAVVAKHGNRAVSSKCGSADVLKGLGVNIEIPPERVAQILEEVGITFLFAPLMHGAMKFAAPVRRDLGIRTIFNILGPLTNPAGAKRQLLGVFDESLTEPMAGVLRELGSEQAIVVHGDGGFDELSTLGRSTVSELRNGIITTYQIDAQGLGVRRAKLEDLKGGDVEMNVQLIRSILDGKEGPRTDIAVLNAGAALIVAGRAGTLEQGMDVARHAVESGAALQKLNHWIEATNR